jgi:hypothetical protein
MRTRLILIFILKLHFVQAQVWQSVGDGINKQPGQSVNDMLVFHDTLYMIGQFDSLYNPQQYCSGFAGWDSLNWHCKGPTLNIAQGGLCINTFQNEIYVGGDFNWVIQPSLNGIGRFDGTQFQPLGKGVNNGMVRCMQEYNGSLYIGGNFVTVDSVLNARRIARWDGSQWHKIGTGLTGGLTNLYAMTVYNGELYIAGDCSSLDGFPCKNICRFNGTAWDSLQSGIIGFVRSMVVDSVNNILYVGGTISSAGGIPTPTGVAAWNGTNWSAVGVAPILNPVDLVMYRGVLFAGGIQKGPNSLGQTVFQMAWFDGQNWIPACDTMDGSEIESMHVYKDELYVGGYFKMIDDSARYGIARTHFPNVGINENSSLGNIVKVFPNPAMSKVFITSSRSLNETVITLFNIHSQILLQQSPGFGNNFELTIPPDIGTGIYMLRIQSKEGVVTKKIVVGR